MHDSFTRVVPSYCHVASTGFTAAHSHKMHPEYKETVDRTPMVEIDRAFTKKNDTQKTYREDIKRLGKFGPQPLKGKRFDFRMSVERY